MIDAVTVSNVRFQWDAAINNRAGVVANLLLISGCLLGRVYFGPIEVVAMTENGGSVEDLIVVLVMIGRSGMEGLNSTYDETIAGKRGIQASQRKCLEFTTVVTATGEQVAAFSGELKR